MGSVVVGNWSDICKELLGKVPLKFFGGRIELKWLKDNFKDIDESLNPLEREQYTQVYIMRLIRGVLMPDKA
ncbi:hypothetical protein Gotri_006204 [Gossypium trilobum]|uniref:Uncharacterized protein n=1 Tax=Gossypium trilobum TaxID=34281 RepID=A0A7J9EZ48_9ROSI|nr:hypothetical protein [Gossypium trilobum]